MFFSVCKYHHFWEVLVAQGILTDALRNPAYNGEMGVMTGYGDYDCDSNDQPSKKLSLEAQVAGLIDSVALLEEIKEQEQIERDIEAELDAIAEFESRFDDYDILSRFESTSRMRFDERLWSQRRNNKRGGQKHNRRQRHYRNNTVPVRCRHTRRVRYPEFCLD